MSERTLQIRSDIKDRRTAQSHTTKILYLSRNSERRGGIRTRRDIFTIPATARAIDNLLKERETK